MKRMRKLSIFGAALLLGGCAAYRMPPLTESHPANPAAMASSGHPIARTLAYTSADIPSVQPVAAPSERGKESGGVTAPIETVVGEGKVIATVPNAGQIVVDHQEIKGFMEAMTMGYRIDPPSLLEGLKFGDRIRFTIDVQKKAIVKIETLP